MTLILKLVDFQNWRSWKNGSIKFDKFGVWMKQGYGWCTVTSMFIWVGDWGWLGSFRTGSSPIRSCLLRRQIFPSANSSQFLCSSPSSPHTYTCSSSFHFYLSSGVLPYLFSFLFLTPCCLNKIEENREIGIPVLFFA